MNSEIDGDLMKVALHGLECASSWVSNARLIGDCRACDLKAIFEEYLALKSSLTVTIEDLSEDERQAIMNPQIPHLSECGKYTIL
jgi:hypothetical protein